LAALVIVLVSLLGDIPDYLTDWPDDAPRLTC
jgi:hypothetical protein